MSLLDLFTIGLSIGLGIGTVQILADSVRVFFAAKRLKKAMKAMDSIKLDLASLHTDVDKHRH